LAGKIKHVTQLASGEGCDITTMTAEDLERTIHYDIELEQGPGGTILEWLPLLADTLAELLKESYGDGDVRELVRVGTPPIQTLVGHSL
jgi:hypothetical protein